MKMNKILIKCLGVIFLSLSINNIQAQTTFENYYFNSSSNGDYLKSIIETPSGDFVFAGMYHDGNNNLNKGSILKVNPQGDTIWTKLFRGSYEQNLYSDYFTKIIIPNSGGFLAVGSRNTGSFNEDVWTTQIDDNGVLGNDLNYNSGGVLSDWGNSVIKSTSGGYVIVGKGSIPATMTSPAIPYGLIIKANDNGNVVWSNLGGSTYEMNYIRDVISTSDGGYIVCGYGGNNPVVKYDSNGGVVWQCNLGTDKNLFSIKILNNGNVVVVGLKINASNNTTNRYYAIISQSGNLIHDAEYDDTNFQYQFTYFDMSELFYSVANTSDGGFVAVGTVNYDLYYHPEAIVNKFDASGNLLWTKWITAYDSYLFDVTECLDGGIITCGSIGGSQYVCKMDSYGNGCNSVTLINEISPKDIIEIFPNPCNSCKIIGVENSNDLFVTDILGRKVSASFIKSSNGYFINLDDKGIFFIRNFKTGQVVKFVRE